MDITLFNWSGLRNTVNKELSDGTTVSGYLFAETEVLKPVFRIRRIGEWRYNYIHAPTLGRYFFVNSVRAYNDRWEVFCSCDVLMTYRDQINALTAPVVSTDDNGGYASNRTNVFDTRAQLDRRAFPVTGLFSKEGSIIMLTLKGSE